MEILSSFALMIDIPKQHCILMLLGIQYLVWSSIYWYLPKYIRQKTNC